MTLHHPLRVRLTVGVSRNGTYFQICSRGNYADQTPRGWVVIKESQ